mmetsp:Transcript_49474/g.107507  ORF Transcript_49474/g.107507 Transcript_49474/m.107507 type:complete len:299 (+) Transcript_49474:155-1051(+)|eukprot:CAMPEP_0175828700 /NCGR_PEP_ID=MMETSP0107_2-20121207/12946_1 /TAXON_ID=195067 ORGANISM="Goniomonas pacifica, Strain CCMP1869" /NCGR_SAMPLE_ID=MMETSP0107_2 /ASSEMBLY_ACC=CAM_ASM_000203 /LENGTH=298 /DNA_ID=CAMNT_0017141439 /DNA_START=147 /DNA_END=1043 /DNA_ORIENTATION=+
MPTHRLVKIDELSQYFHLPEKAVARQLGVCLTSLKKICRQNGITRWPYRKLKSLDKKINKIENALTNTAEDPSAMIIKWEMLKLEKKNLPFSGPSDDSDTETKTRGSPMTEACTRSPGTPSPASDITESTVGEAPFPPVADWAVHASSPSVASGSTTPHEGAPSRVVHTMLEKKLRQVGCVAAHREALAARASSGQTPTDAARHRPCDLDLPTDDFAAPVETLSEEDRSRLADFYARPDSARGVDAGRFLADSALGDSFHFLSPNHDFTIGEMFPVEEPMPNLSADALLTDEFLLLSS